jgi:hypothetical protein
MSPDKLGEPKLDLLADLKVAGAFTPKQIGIANASTFPGFCGAHDHDTFAPIEECELNFDDEQCFLLTYRPACMELWAQRAKANVLKTAIDQEGPFNFLEAIRDDGDIALAENLERKAQLDLILLSGTFGDIHALVLDFDGNPGVATAGVFAPEVDFADHPLQDIQDLETPLQYVSYSIIPSAAGGHAIIGWHGNSAVADDFVSSLLSLDASEWPDALLRVAFESLENTYFSPHWWDDLNEEQKHWAGLRATLGAITTKPISYKPDGVTIATLKASVVRHS